MAKHRENFYPPGSLKEPREKEVNSLIVKNTDLLARIQHILRGMGARDVPREILAKRPKSASPNQPSVGFLITDFPSQQTPPPGS